MRIDVEPKATPPRPIAGPSSIVHIVAGVPIEVSAAGTTGAADVGTTLAVDLDRLVWRRSEPLPAAETPMSEIIDLLGALSARLRTDEGGHLDRALAGFEATAPNAMSLLERSYSGLWRTFAPDLLRFQLETELGGLQALDGWRAYTSPDGTVGHARACPSRLLHVMAGNGPGVAALTIVRGALTKSVNLLKLPSNDLFTAPAILCHLAAEAPDHPITRSFSAVYWRGGDESVESVLMSSLWFDKIVAWGGEASIRSAARWIGPGLELVAFDPKNSISLIGNEAFASEQTIREAAVAAAIDATVHDQDACTASRFQFVEGDVEQVDRFCRLLVAELGVAREKASACGPAVPADIRDEIDAIRGFEPEYRVWGSYDGSGMVIRSDEPVDFYPSGKVVNVVPVASLGETTRHVTVATQTVGIYPSRRRAELRDPLCAAGAQRICALGQAGNLTPGLPHDGFYPLARFVRWVRDD